jgi:AcrR family transcriptional regulator
VKQTNYEKLVLPKLDIIEGWARNGLTLEDIAHNLGIGRTTFYKYTQKHKELKDALEQGKEVADIRVENALYRRAVGFYSEEEQIVMVKDPDGETRPETVTKKVYHKPDVTAQIFWLKNRRPDKWRDKVNEFEAEETQNLIMIAPVKEKNE